LETSDEEGEKTSTREVYYPPRKKKNRIKITRLLRVKSKPSRLKHPKLETAFEI